MHDPLFIENEIKRICRTSARAPLRARSLLRELGRQSNGIRGDQQLRASLAQSLISAEAENELVLEDDAREICLSIWDESASSLPATAYQTASEKLHRKLSELFPKTSYRWTWLRLLTDPNEADHLRPFAETLTRPLSPAQRLLFRGETYLAWREFELEQQSSSAELAYGLFLDTENLLAHARSKVKTKPQEAVVALLGLTARGHVECRNERDFQRLLSDSLDPLTGVARIVCSPKTVALSETLRAVALTEKLESHELRLLSLAAIARRQRQDRKFTYALATERLYCSQFGIVHADDDITTGPLRDPWNLLKAAPLSTKHTSVRSSSTRLRQALSVSMRLSRILGPKRVAFLLAGKTARVRLTGEELESLSREIADVCAALKGPLMKVGQTASYFPLGLPDSVTSSFRRLQHQVYSLPWETVENRISKVYGADWKLRFSSIDQQAIGCGSIAQIHRARLATGEEVALKLKLPNIEKHIESDLAILRGLLHVGAWSAKVTGRGFPIGGAAATQVRLIIDEVEKQMRQECDLNAEAQSMIRASERFSTDREIRIPKVFLEHSNSEILVQEFVRGRHLDELTEQDKPRMNSWGQAIVRFVVTSCRDADFNSDPHPGNFLFTEDFVYCLDFGSTIRWSQQNRNTWNDLIDACNNRNFEAFRSALDLSQEDAETQRPLFEILSWSGPGSWNVDVEHPLSEAVIKNQLNEMTHYLPQNFLAQFDGARAGSLPPILMFGLRVYFGHLAVVAKLGSIANWHQIVNAIMKPRT